MVAKIKADLQKEKDAEFAAQVAKIEARKAAPKNPAVKAAKYAAAAASLEINAAVNAEKARIEAELAAAEVKKKEIEEKIKNPPAPRTNLSGEDWTANMPEHLLKGY